MADYDDDMMEEAEDAQPPQRVRSQVTAVRKQKGRGFREGMDADDERHAGRGYESLETGSGPGPAKCAPLAPRSPGGVRTPTMMRRRSGAPALC
jgi:hypothetical protein